MTAKEYLRQLEDIDININQELERLQELKERAASIGALDYSKDRVQTSPQDTLCNSVTNYISLNEQINAQIDRYTDMKSLIISQIRGLHNSNYNQILYKVYVQFKSIRIASDEMHRSYSYTLELHKKALNKFEKTYKNLAYLI